MYDMSHPTSFLVLDNKELGTFWVGQTNIKPGANDRAIGRDKLIDKLSSKYEEEYPHLCFNVESVACEIYKFHEIENWVTGLIYEIKRKPTKLGELQQLLTAGWTEWDYTTNSTIHVLRVSKTREGLRNTYKRLISEWEAKGLRCLNTQKCKTYEHKKKDPNFMYNKARKEILRRMKKTGKMPKQSTIDKYQIKEDELKECMEEEAPCQPCEKNQNKECMGRKGIIYKITSPSGKVYVGQTICSFEKRMREHKNPNSGCTAISNAIQKYGNQMKYEIIEDNVPHEHLDDREIYWIKELNSMSPDGYNLNSGGNAKHLITQEAKDRVRDGLIKSKIDRDGYVGFPQQRGNLFVPMVRIDKMSKPISNGSFHKKEDAIEVLKEYTKDLDNFIKVDGDVPMKVGSISKHGNRYTLKYRNEYLGSYETEEKAHMAFEVYLKNPENMIKGCKEFYGSVCKHGNKWQLKYKKKYLGLYKTREEGLEALQRYINDPENFPTFKHNVGNIRFKGNRWQLTYKNKYIGSYTTKEEAEEALQSSIYTSSSEIG
jgi:hypothetical protein